MMKQLLRLFPLLVLGLLAVACGDDAPGDDHTDGSLSVSVPTVTAVTSSSAIVSATATGSGITSRGVCYSTSANPTVNDQKVVGTSANMNVTLGGLAENTTYHVRAYAQTNNEVKYSADVTFTTLTASSEEEEEQTEGPEALKRVSVHDPSVVWDPSSNNYYIFGSHRAAARSTNMMTWEAFTAPWATATSTNAANSAAFTTPQVTKVKKGGKEVDFTFDAQAWSKRGNTAYNVDGNMWAPDVIYNKAMGKWCMYLSINGDNWYSSIIMLTADKITGPYRYQAPVVISGFHTGNAYKDTDLEIVLGEQASLPDRYAVGNKWGSRYPNCIDPCVV